MFYGIGERARRMRNGSLRTICSSKFENRRFELQRSSV